MEVLELLDLLQEIIETATKIPVTGKIIVNKREISEVVDKIINCIPDEFKKAQWILEEKERILSEAINESELLKKENINRLRKQVENHDISKEAQSKSEEIITSAQRDAKSMRLGAREYADEILTQLEKEIDGKGSEMVISIKKQVESFIEGLEDDVSDKTNTIRDNIKELRNMK